MNFYFERYHETLIPQVGAEKQRCYYIPFPNDTFSMIKTDSTQVTLLFKWKFAFYERYREGILQQSPEKEYDVPFMWQLKGFDYNQYANFFYPFPFDPPFIRKDNPCGVYETEYFCENNDEKRYLVFDGVDSCLYLFVNGTFVGYSTVSHCQAEFDITPFLKKGEKNTLTVLVFKWCAGSYLEDQDKLRMSGIFRDVYVLSRPAEHITDYKIVTDTDGTNGTISFSCDKSATVRLYDGNVLLAEKTGEELEFAIENAKLWTSETPNLYRLVISYNGEFMEEVVGIRHVEVLDGIFTVNYKPVKFKGVNRHCMTTEGYVESLEIMQKDIELFKKYNINAVRTSHYPPHPDFLRLCDENGIYVMDEADIESHGLATIHYQGSDSKWDYLADHPDWLHVYLHRQERMYERDKNRQCIVMWSLGNEAGWGNNFKECIKYLHSVDTRPVHYEGCRVLATKEWREVELLDVASCMYVRVENCKQRIESGVGMPFVLCEYTHAMGNSCGDVKKYWDYIYSEERFCGAFVWEWCNHSVKIGEGQYIFGGDFHEKEPPSRHEGNFCVDGLVDTDRRVHPSLEEVAQVYAPVDVAYENGEYVFINRYDFSSLDGLKCVATKRVNGVVAESVNVDITGIPARQRKAIALAFAADENSYTTVDFEFSTADGRVCARRQAVLSDRYPTSKTKETATVERTATGAKICGKDYAVEIAENGMISSIVSDGMEYLKNAVRLQLYRATIDNDMPYLVDWMRERLEFIRPTTVSMEVQGNTVKIFGRIVADIVEPLYDYELEYQGFADRVEVSVNAKKREWVLSVPRFGFGFDLDGTFAQVEYFGRGTDEAYLDRLQNCPVGLYNGEVSSMNFEYQKAQESGSHCGSRMVNVFNSQKKGLIIESETDFSFSAKPYAYNECTRHNFELPTDTGKTVLSVDYKMAGVGSAACGPELDACYRILEDEIIFKFSIKIK